MRINKVSILITGLVITGCASQPSAPFTEHDPRIIGSWYGTYLDLGYTSYGEKAYFADGTACGFILTNYVGGMELSLVKSTWRIADGKLISTPVISNDQDIPVGVPIVDKIVAVTPTMMTLDAMDGDNPYNRYRYPEDRGKKLCDLKDWSRLPSSDGGP